MISDSERKPTFGSGPANVPTDKKAHPGALLWGEAPGRCGKNCRVGVPGYFSGKKGSRALFSVGLKMSDPTTMSTSATVMPIVI